jgi:glycosyltransferase involved in cell wall biosynthesis
VDAITAQSARQAELVRRHYGREAVIIPNPYAPPPRLRARRDDLVLWVGVMRQQKRPDRFIDLARALPQYRFRMIGGPDGYIANSQAYYEAIRAEATTVPNLEFLGFLPVADVEPHFDEARVLVNTSEYEGFPNTFLQAWARGVPTVSFFDAGAREDGSRPFAWVRSGADARDAANTLLADPRQWQAMSDACRSHCLAFNSVESVVKSFDGLFNSLAG